MERISISMKNISFCYEKDNFIFNNFSIQIDSGLKIGIFGPSGSGKSTLLALMSGMLFPMTGEVTWDINGNIYKNKEISNIRAKYSSFMLQHHFLLNYLTVEENILLALKKNINEDDKEKCFDLIKKLGLSKCYKRFPTSISGGEKQRSSLGRSLITEKGLIFVDEPTARLDRKNAKEISDLLISCFDKQTTIIASHDEYLLEKCDKMIEIG